MPVLKNISQLAVCPPGTDQRDAGIIDNACLVWRGRDVAWVGSYHDLPGDFADEPVTDCGGRLVIPGLVDCHTHLCFGGWRDDEFALRIRGASYQEIASAGGGINSTVTATRASSFGELLRKTRSHLDDMLALGITTVECKSGYGLDADNELKQLEIYRQLGQQHVITLVPTFLGAHTIPREFSHQRERYVGMLCNELIPEVARRGLARFCDVSVEEGAFTLDEGRQILASARSNSLGIKIHADQLSDGDGASLAAEFGATSAEHLEYISEKGILALAEAGVVAVSLPLASLYLRDRYMPARRLIDAGVGVAVATDFNPGSAPSFHLPLAMTLACLYQSMTPAEVLMGATVMAARAVGMAGTIGSLVPDHRADFAVIDAPTLDHWLYHFRGNACQAVAKNGNWVTPVRQEG